jgi:hypothetical protein
MINLLKSEIQIPDFRFQINTDHLLLLIPMCPHFYSGKKKRSAKVQKCTGAEVQ